MFRKNDFREAKSVPQINPTTRANIILGAGKLTTRGRLEYPHVAHVEFFHRLNLGPFGTKLRVVSANQSVFWSFMGFDWI